MRLRRLEFVVIGVTLAFACFIGGYFTGRSVSAVSVAPVVVQQNDARQVSGTAEPSEPGTPPVTENKNVVPPSENSRQAPEAVGTPRDSDGRININSASRSELMDLPGIGGVLSERIVEYRKTNGPFSKIEDLRNVPGIGEKRYETICDRITVG